MRTVLDGAKKVALMNFQYFTKQNLYLANLLRASAEDYCEEFLEEKDFCRSFALWQANYGFSDKPEDTNDYLSEYAFLHVNDISWTECSEIYKRYHEWYLNIFLVQTKETSKKIHEKYNTDIDDPFERLIGETSKQNE